ncbi:hypothetical protein [Alcanivorax sp. 1008]|uniref:hypothetical protein n=1 Tax=Alcanivorax sp. 1008 TaxID=2816853 RepID=UPI001D8A80AC|nr:hypothetical protein [Alcanivorax sp. 1008]MCC1495824.1 hypothetical protein [Alcanivorax sp. 1008]
MKLFGKHIISFFVVSLMAANANADKVWLFEDVLIEAVVLSDVSGTIAAQIHMDHANQSDNNSYVCAPTSQNKIVSYWNGSASSLLQTFLSTAMAAQAQGLRVDIMVDTSSCNTSNNWPNDGANGLGFYLQGIRIKGPDYDLP